jgi:hypothetical protein
LTNINYSVAVIAAAHDGPIGPSDLEATRNSFTKMDADKQTKVFRERLQSLNQVLTQRAQVVIQHNAFPLSVKEYFIPENLEDFKKLEAYLSKSGSPRALGLRLVLADALLKIRSFMKVIEQ